MNVEKIEQKYLQSKNEDTSFVKDLKTAMATQLPGWKITDEYLDILNAEGPRKTLRVEPVSGGSAKVADYRNGVVSIMQG